MRTTVYNPSELEVAFANALEKLKASLEAELPKNSIQRIENNNHLDNPVLRFHLKDTDGDHHELVIKVIQVPDKE